MTIKTLLPKGKKALLNKIFGSLFNKFNNYSYTVVLEACTEFHFEHLKNVIELLLLHPQLKIIVVTPAKVSLPSTVSVYKSIYDFPFYRTPSLFISTEFGRKLPWFTCSYVYFGHGIGPKLNYQGSSKLTDCDYIFSPCKPIYQTQLNFISADKAIPIGLPILDKKTNSFDDILQHFSLNNEKPLIVYAPSWCNDINKISNINEINNFLIHQEDFNVIVSPHPNLFKPERCSNKVYFSPIEKHKLVINEPNGIYTSLDIVKAADIVISDISSILFEAMALDKIVAFDGNRDIYEYCEALFIYDELINNCYTPDWQKLNDKVLMKAIENDHLKSIRNKFINDYLFNKGNASKAFVTETLRILELS